MNIQLISITKNAEDVIEDAARVCYKSKKNNNTGILIKNLIKNKHYSVLEHGYATFKICGCSRAMSHQLVRHRFCSFSQESQRYVKEDQFEFVIPDSIKDLYKTMDISDWPRGTNVMINDFKHDMEIIQGMYNKWKARGIKNEDARFVLPNACQTDIVVTANFREWRHIIEVRCEKNAQWEIRNACLTILNLLYKECPNVFNDLKEKFEKGV